MQVKNQYRRSEALNLRFLGLSMSVNEIRHCMIGIAQQFLEPNRSATALQQAMAACSDHTVEVETAHYAIQYKDAPRLTSGAVQDARYCLHEWWKAIGACGAEGKVSLPLFSRPVVDAEDVSSKSHVLSEEKDGDSGGANSQVRSII